MSDDDSMDDDLFGNTDQLSPSGTTTLQHSLGDSNEIVWDLADWCVDNPSRVTQPELVISEASQQVIDALDDSVARDSSIELAGDCGSSTNIGGDTHETLIQPQ